jgi:hypothetical protein
MVTSAVVVHSLTIADLIRDGKLLAAENPHRFPNAPKQGQVYQPRAHSSPGAFFFIVGIRG